VVQDQVLAAWGGGTSPLPICKLGLSSQSSPTQPPLLGPEHVVLPRAVLAPSRATAWCRA